MVDGEKTLLFANREELKWYLHAKLCRGEDAVMSEFYMNKVYEKKVGSDEFIDVETLNFELRHTPYRVKDPEET